MVGRGGSCHRTGRAGYEAFRWLAAGSAPDYRAIARFRKRHLSALGHLFVQALALCQTAGMVRLGRVALDGARVRDNAAKRKAMSYALSSGVVGARVMATQGFIDVALKDAIEDGTIPGPHLVPAQRCTRHPGS